MIERDGYLWLRGAVDPSPFGSLFPADASNARHVERHPQVQTLIEQLRPHASEILEHEAHFVRAIFFNKAGSANWVVPWHQDAVVKDGFRQLAPNRGELELMLAFRVHIDPADARNGCLRVIPGSHGGGILNDNQVDNWKMRGPEVACAANPGDVLVMRPLLLHASSKAADNRSRRVIHIEFAAWDARIIHSAASGWDRSSRPAMPEPMKQ